MMRCLTAFLLLSGTAFSANTQELPFKQVAAPAEDILSGRVRLPEPSACATDSRAALVPIEFVWTSDRGWSFETQFSIATRGPVSLAMLAFDSSRWTSSVRPSTGSFEPIGSAFGSFGVEHRTQVLDSDALGWTVDRYDAESVPEGAWTVLITAPNASPTTRPGAGWFIVRDATNIALSAYTSTLATLSDSEIGIQAYLYDTQRNQDASRTTRRDPASAAPVRDPLRNAVRSGEVVVETAKGTQRLALFDDGLHADGDRRDGVFGAVLPRWTSGDVRARVEIQAVTAEGAAFTRSVQLQFPSIERRTSFSGTVTSSVEDALRLRIELGALPLGPPSQLHVSTEVWGTDAQGEFVPVCWLSRMVIPEVRGGEWKLPLYLDGRWIDVARAKAPFALHNVRVQDPDTHIPYDVVDWLPLTIAALPPIVGLGTNEVTRSMLMSPASSALMQPTGPVLRLAKWSPSNALLLVHGYCSSGSIWPAADFTQPKIEFLDPNRNRTHDQFAQLLLLSAGRHESFGIVGHSQAGPAALQLYTYYASPLDRASGPRRIQTVASPYQGTPLASLGSFACGVNNDMTPSGSTTWLAGIPTWARAEVWYWTTSDNGSACNFFTGLLLTNPEDGTVEMFRGQLPGANSMGHVVGWCHTTGMSYPANYTDHARNAVMNANAAR